MQAGIRKGFEQIYHESLRNVILPGYEKSSQELFRQLNITFSAGTKECKYQRLFLATDLAKL